MCFEQLQSSSTFRTLVKQRRQKRKRGARQVGWKRQRLVANPRKLLFEFCVVEGVAAGQQFEKEDSERPSVGASDVEVAVAVEDELGRAVEERVLAQPGQRRLGHVDRRVHHVESDVCAKLNGENGTCFAISNAQAFFCEIQIKK